MPISRSVFDSHQVIPYVTFGLRGADATVQFISALFDSGCNIVEIGVPFSDPLADGAVIQRSHHEALSSGEDVSVSAVFLAVKTLKAVYPTKTIVLMIATHLVMHYGETSFFSDASSHGVDGVILPDLSVVHAPPIVALGDAVGVDVVLLLSTLASLDRQRDLLALTRGFCYMISSAGTTGVRSSFATGLIETLKACRANSDVPLCVGFGVKSREQVAQLAPHSQGVIVGSFFESIIQNASSVDDATEQLVAAFKDLAQSS